MFGALYLKLFIWALGYLPVIIATASTMITPLPPPLEIPGVTIVKVHTVSSSIFTQMDTNLLLSDPRTYGEFQCVSFTPTILAAQL